MRVPEPKARAFYLKEAEAQEWNTRELERQIRMLAYERVIANQIEDGALNAAAVGRISDEIIRRRRKLEINVHKFLGCILIASAAFCV
jgi:predicted nuclease of restriction endonuclease-like (RecB) superfamily